jgi:hypothetical protein
MCTIKYVAIVVLLLLGGCTGMLQVPINPNVIPMSQYQADTHQCQIYQAQGDWQQFQICQENMAENYGYGGYGGYSNGYGSGGMVPSPCTINGRFYWATSGPGQCFDGNIEENQRRMMGY